jgi:hypothetical protein
MSIYNDFYLILFPSQYVAAIAFCIWRYKLMPKDIDEKYPFLIKFQSEIPFYLKWENKVDKADVPIFKKCRKADLLFYGFLGVTVALELMPWGWLTIRLHM